MVLIVSGDDPAAISSSGTDDETSNEGAAGMLT